MSFTGDHAPPLEHRRPRLRSRVDLTWLALAGLATVWGGVTVVLLAVGVPGVGAAASAYGLGLAVVVLLLYVVDLVGTFAGWQVVVDTDRANLPAWLGSAVLPFAVLVLGLLFGHFVW